MDAQSATPIDDTPFATFPKSLTMLADAMLEWWEIAQLPLLIGLNWWAESADARWRHLTPGAAHHEPVLEHHNELIVPDILEEDGEHALFA